MKSSNLRIAAAGSPGQERAVGLEIARELLEAVRPMVEGLLLSGPLARTDGPPLFAGFIGRAVAQRRAFPGRPGIRGGAESTHRGGPD